MPLHESTECTQEVLLGNAPASYFLIGVLEIFSSAFICIVLFNRNCFPSLSQSKMVTYILPVYLSVVIPLLVFCFLIGIHCILGVFTTSKDLLIVKWTALRFVSEGLSIFLLHPGIGIFSFRRSANASFLWSVAHGAAVLGALYGGGFQAMLYTTMAILAELIVFYILMILIPTQWLHRRPAILQFSLLNMFILSYQLSVVIVYLATEPQHGVSNACLVEMSFSITEYLQICIILYAFCLDSQFWQGLYISNANNLNEPLRDIWVMNRQEVNLVAQSVIQLEKKVVPIIPFSQLRVDTSKYFSGGTARVYRGTYQNDDVAIKFLFCIELTPDRIVDFCSEATMLNSLRHENIVTCYGVAIMPPAISLVTEYCIWGSLFDFLHATDLVCDFPDNDDEEDEEDVDDEYSEGYSSADNDRDDDDSVSDKDEEQGNSSFINYIEEQGNISQHSLNRSQLSTNETKEPDEQHKVSRVRSPSSNRTSRHSSTNRQRKKSISRHSRDRNSTHRNRDKAIQSNSNIFDYVSSLFSNLYPRKKATKHATHRKKRSENAVTQNPVHTGMVSFPTTDSSDDVNNNNSDNSSNNNRSNNENWSLMRYLDPGDQGENADPQDVASKLANAMMTASIDSRDIYSSSKYQPKTPLSYEGVKTNRPFFSSLRIPARSRGSSSESKISSSMHSAVSIAPVTIDNVNTAMSNADLEQGAVQPSGKTDKDDRIAYFEDHYNNESDGKSWHSLSISQSLLSKHYINAAVFLSPPPTASQTASSLPNQSQQQRHASMGKKQNRPTTHRLHLHHHHHKHRKHSSSQPQSHLLISRLHHSQHHIRSLNQLHHPSPSSATQPISQGRNRASTVTNLLNSTATNAHTSGSYRMSDSSGGNGGSNNNSFSGKLNWKSPAAVMLTAEMGFGIGPGMSGGTNSSASNSYSFNASNINNNTTSAGNNNRSSTSVNFNLSGSLSRSAVKYVNVKRPASRRRRTSSQNSASSTSLNNRSRNNSSLPLPPSYDPNNKDAAPNGITANENREKWSGSFSWAPLKFLFSNSSPTNAARKRLNTTSSVTSTVSNPVVPTAATSTSHIIGNYNNNSHNNMKNLMNNSINNNDAVIGNANAIDETSNSKKFDLKRALLPNATSDTTPYQNDHPIDSKHGYEAAVLSSLNASNNHTNHTVVNTIINNSNLDKSQINLSMSLQSSIQSLGHLIPTSVRFVMIRDCAAGLAYLHSRGFMHCDIKSLNFLVTHQLVVKLADLGEARLLPTRSPNKSIGANSPSFFGSKERLPMNNDSEEIENVDLNSNNDIYMGDNSEESDFEYEDIDDTSSPEEFNEEEEESLPSNINWSSPETLQRSLMRHDGYYIIDSNTNNNNKDKNAGLIRRKRRIKVNERADVWSLAMVMYEILSGEVPFDTDECRSLSFDLFLQKVKMGLRPTLPVEYQKNFWLVELINRAWTFHAAKRCTAGDIRDTLNGRIRPRAVTPTVVSTSNK